MKYIVVVPTYNEAENLPNLIRVIFLIPLDIDILVVDDASPDGTAQIVAELAQQAKGKLFLINRAGKLGLRSAYIEGFQKAFSMNADAIIQMDADFSHDPAVILKMAQKIEDFDLIIGSRYVSGGSLDRAWSAWRKSLSAFGNLYARTILGLPTRDVTTGYRMWRADALKKMPLERVRSNGYSFLVEMVYIAYLLKFRITEVPIHFANRQAGKSKMSLNIQMEAAIRIWDVLWRNRDLRKK